MQIRWPIAELLELKQSVKSTVTYLEEICGEQRPVFPWQVTGRSLQMVPIWALKVIANDWFSTDH